MRFGLFAAILVVGCADPPPGETLDGGAIVEPVTELDIDVRITADFVFVYARDPALTCDCQDGTFPAVGVCAQGSDTPQCNCAPAFPVSTAPCLDSLTLTQTNVSPPRVLEFPGGSVAVLTTTVFGIDNAAAEFTLAISGCGGDMEVPLSALPAAPPVTRARREADGVVLNVDDPFESVVFSFGQCGIAAADEVLIEDAWTSGEGLSGAVSLRSRSASIDDVLGNVSVWHEHRQISRVLAATANDDGTFTLPIDRRVTIELKTTDGDVNDGFEVVDARASASGELVSFEVTGEPSPDTPPGLAITAARFSAEAVDGNDAIELDIGGATFRALLPHVDRRVFVAEGLQIGIGRFPGVGNPITFEDVAAAQPPIETSEFFLSLFTRDAFVTGIE